MTTQSPTLIDFIAHLKEASKPVRLYASSWVLRATDKTICEFCGSTSTLGLTPLIPVSCGATFGADNRVVACRSCSTRLAKTDPVDASFVQGLAHPLSDDLLARRHKALLHGRNHLTALPQNVAMSRVEAALSERFKHPRIRCFASCSSSDCFIGWLKKHGSPASYSEAAGVLRMGFGAIVLEEEGALVFCLDPANFYDAVWALVELNALVLPLGDTQTVLDPDNWKRCWVDTYDRLSDNRRRYRTGQPRRPWPPKVLSQNPATVRSRRRKANKEREALVREKELRYSKALSTAWRNYNNPNHRMYFERPSEAELDLMYREACLLELSKKDRLAYKLKNNW